MKFQGVFSVLPTPFLADGSVDTESLRRVVDLFIAAGVNGLTALGVTSEVSRLDERERALVLATVIDQAARRVPVIAGATAEGLGLAIGYGRAAREAGAAAIMVSPPRMPKINSDAVVRHFAALAEAVEIPIVVQDYPPISGYTMEPWLLARIARETPLARTIKLEDPPTPLKTAQILARAEGVDVSVLGGLGGVFMLEELMSGAAGVMTGFAFPEVLVEIYRRFRSGDVDGAADVFYRNVPVMRFEFQEGIGMAIRKEVLRRRGAIAWAGTRPPGAVLDKETAAALDRVLSWTAAGSASTQAAQAARSQSPATS
ncbi:MAG TPA: dihydrodipicolinate synthase family protein [Bryobacteraceae bacterium]|nr:dihydrodipicolinate synthase family protein [Bryobacteraceae bacterium]